MGGNFYHFKEYIQRLDEGSNPVQPSPDFTPHEEFHKYRWLLPNSGSWYYKLKDFKPCVLPKDPDFAKSLDPKLRTVVDFLHSKKIPTTPSCSGHFYSPDEWEMKYNELEDNAKEIRKNGLRLHDPEDGHKFQISQNPKYSLPWTKKAFIERANEHSKFGVLGMYDPGNFFAKRIQSQRIPNSQLKKDGALTLFMTSPRTPSQLNECWQKFTEAVTKNPLS